MALTSTLYTGLSGLNANQTRLNVIGNNIANVNTTAFKSSRALFKPQVYVTDSAGGAPNASYGGTNPSQRGLGTQVAAVQKNFNAGSLETTGRNTDMAIEGNGFFVVESSGRTTYTRDGSFSLNADNRLVSSRGEFVQGYSVDADFNVIPGTLGELEIPLGELSIAAQTTEVGFKGNLNANGDLASGASVLQSPALVNAADGPPDGLTPLVDLRLPGELGTPLFDTSGPDPLVLTAEGRRADAVVPAASLTVTDATTLDELNAFLVQTMQVDTSVPGPPGYTPGGAVTAGAVVGDPANTRRLALTGNAGKANSLSITALTLSDGTSPFAFSPALESNPVGESMRTSLQVFDSLGTPIEVDVTVALESKTNGGTSWRYYATSAADTDGPILGTGTIAYDERGNFISNSSDSIRLDRIDSGATTPLQVQLDFSATTSQTYEGSTFVSDDQDGFESQELSNFSIDADGTINGIFSKGQLRKLGQIALAAFDNPQGLIDEGSNNFSVGASSGTPVVSAAGQFNSGKIRAQTLEQSNVDLSKEFIDMIITSTGFSAASRVISTSDRLLTELLQTGR